MPNPNAIVANVLRVEPPLEAGDRRERTVVLEGERRARLDPGNPRSGGFAQILDGLRKMGMPVYVEVDPTTLAVTRLLIPDVTRVLALRESNDGLLVDGTCFAGAPTTTSSWRRRCASRCARVTWSP